MIQCKNKNLSAIKSYCEAACISPVKENDDIFFTCQWNFVLSIKPVFSFLSCQNGDQYEGMLSATKKFFMNIIGVDNRTNELMDRLSCLIEDTCRTVWELKKLNDIDALRRLTDINEESYFVFQKRTYYHKIKGEPILLKEYEVIGNNLLYMIEQFIDELSGLQSNNWSFYFKRNTEYDHRFDLIKAAMLVDPINSNMNPVELLQNFATKLSGSQILSTLSKIYGFAIDGAFDFNKVILFFPNMSGSINHPIMPIIFSNSTVYTLWGHLAELIHFVDQLESKRANKLIHFPLIAEINPHKSLFNIDIKMLRQDKNARGNIHIRSCASQKRVNLRYDNTNLTCVKIYELFIFLFIYLYTLFALLQINPLMNYVFSNYPLKANPAKLLSFDLINIIKINIWENISVLRLLELKFPYWFPGFINFMTYLLFYALTIFNLIRISVFFERQLYWIKPVKYILHRINSLVGLFLKIILLKHSIYFLPSEE